MTLHKLSAGDGYTYLTSQVARQDACGVKGAALADYYSAKGEAPGEWIGSGLEGLNSPTVVAGAVVTEPQMLALFGEGQHPDVDGAVNRRYDELVAERTTAGPGRGRARKELGEAGRRLLMARALRETALGKTYFGSSEASEFSRRCAKEFADVQAEKGYVNGTPMPEDERAAVRSKVGAQMFAEKFGRPPADDRELSAFVIKASRTTDAVAGYDTTFSPVKSVSTLWALAPVEVSRVIEEAHDAAVRDALGWLERTAVFTRQGAQGIRQVDGQGLVAAAFVHRDSRAGDPDLHTHVAIANKVQAPDGQWLAIDGRPLHKAAVAASERYNTVLEAELTRRLGVRFAAREQQDPRKRPVREIVGVDPELMASWSSRRAAIDARRAQLEADFQSRHGRPATPRESIRLAQQANLETREAKHEPRSFAEQRAVWATQARTVLGGEQGVAAMVHQALHPTPRTVSGPASESVREASSRDGGGVVGRGRVGGVPSPSSITGGVSRRWAAHVADAVVARVSSDRAVWQAWHLEAEAARQVRAEDRLDPALVDEAISAVLAASLDASRSVPLTREDTMREAITAAAQTATDVEAGVEAGAAAEEPAVLSRRDGSSVYSLARGQMYSSQVVLDAEQAVRDAALRGGGRVLADEVVDEALARATAASGRVLNPGQEQLVREMATSGRRLQLAIAPAGSGKTTAMAVLTDAWTASGGTVVGLSPTAAAAAGLAEETGARAETMAMLVRCLDLPERDRPDWVQAITADTLVVVDEAGMASTADLRAVVDFLDARGATIRLIGDDQQLSSISTGGVLRDIADEAGALTLHELVRFRSPAEAAATLAMRAGDTSAIGFYLDHNRVAVGSESTMVDTTYAAWAADQAEGVSSIMLAPRRDLVAALNARARADRLAREAHAAATMGTGAAALAAEQADDHTASVVLADGNYASVGDTVITRANDRRLRLSAADFVRNGYRWQVTKVDAPTGRIEVASLKTGAVITLPAQYVATSVELGYATTIHAAQGVTVERARVLADDSLDRQMLYVALSRGRGINSLSLVTVGDGDPHDLTTPEVVHPRTATEILEQIVTRDGSQTSATTTARDADAVEPALAHATAVYTDIIRLAAEDTVGPDVLTALTDGAETLLPGVTSEPAWPALRAHLAVIYLDHPETTPDTLAGEQVDARVGATLASLKAAIDSRELDTARDTAAVLDWRLDTPGAPGPLPWLRGIPAVLAADPAWGPHLGARAEHVRQLTTVLRTQAQEWTTATAPAWVTTLGLPLPTDTTPIDTTSTTPATSTGAGRDASRGVGRGAGVTVDLAVWRAAMGVPVQDPTISGKDRLAVAEVRHQRALEQRVMAATGTAVTGVDPITDAAAAIEPRLVTDPTWAATHARLTALARAGVDVPALLAQAGAPDHDLGPLPDDHAPDALWWRITETLGPATLTTMTGDAPARRPAHRPTWTHTLTAELGAARTDAATAHPAWVTLLSCVNAAQRAGLDPDDTIRAAVAMLELSQAPGDGGIRDRDLAPALAHAVNTLTRTLTNPDLTGVPHPADTDDLPPYDPEYDGPAPTDPTTRPTSVAAGDRWEEPGEWAIDEADLWGPTADDLAWLDAQQPTIPPAPNHPTGPVEPAGPVSVDDTLAAAAAERDAVDALRLAFPTPNQQQPGQSSTQQVVDRVVLQRIWDLHAAAQAFYTTRVVDSWVPEYLTERLHHVPTGTGYAPPGWTTLTDHLRTTCAATDDELVTAGLAKISARGTLIDVFRDRATFPLTDPAGNIVGFTARRNPTAGDDPKAGPKYLNTPTTPAFAKSRHLDGLEHLTTSTAPIQDARAGGREGVAGIVLVEGRLDAEAITHASGGRYIGIAPLGTALTEYHAALLTTAASDGLPVIVATDNDNAGRKAAANAYDLLTRHDITPRTVTWPDGTDPADLLHTRGPAALLEALDGHDDQARHIITTLAQPADAFVETRVWAAREAARIAAAQPTTRWNELLDHIQTTTNVGPETAKVALVEAATTRTDTLRPTLPTPTPTTTTRPVLPDTTLPTPPPPTTTTSSGATTNSSGNDDRDTLVDQTPDHTLEHVPGTLLAGREGHAPTPETPHAPEDPRTVARRDPATEWADLANAIDPTITTDPAWTRLAHTLERLHTTGKDIPSLLPALATHAPLDDEHPADDLRTRLQTAYPDHTTTRPTTRDQLTATTTQNPTTLRPTDEQHHHDTHHRNPRDTTHHR